jgi:polysaccharide export outer membrane protein
MGRTGCFHAHSGCPDRWQDLRPAVKGSYGCGLTPFQLGKILEHQLAEFITGPNVTVIVSQMNSKRIYLVGAAKRGGAIPYTHKITVMQF